MNTEHQKINPTGSPKHLVIVFVVFLVIIFVTGMVFVVLNEDNGSAEGPTTQKETATTTTNESDNDTEADTAQASLELLSENCDSNTCIVQGPTRPIGYGWLEGYHEIRERDAGLGGSGGTQQCDVFHVTDGAPAFVNYFKKLVKEGNSVNALADNGDLLLTIGLGSLSESGKEALTRATRDRPAAIQIFQKEVVPMGVPPCYSPVLILDVHQSTPQEIGSTL